MKHLIKPQPVTQSDQTGFAQTEPRFSIKRQFALMKNTIIAWHAHKKERNFSRQSRAINEQYELWESCHFDEVIEKLEKGRVQVLMVAADKQGPDTTEKLQQIGELYPKLQVVALFNSQCNAQTLEQLCHMLCSASQQQQSSTQEAAGALIATLTRRQQQVLNLISQGCSNKQIADKLHMSEGTVKIHCMAIFRGLGVNNRTQAAMLATGVI